MSVFASVTSVEFHRWHHSAIIRHSNSNYVNNLIIWDALFGTRCLPKETQNIDQFGRGKHNAVFPQSWWRQLFIPFQWQAMNAASDPTVTVSNNEDSPVSPQKQWFKGKILQRLAVAGALIYGFLSLIGSNIIPPIYTVRSDVTISATPERSWKISTQALKRGDCGLLLAPLR